MITRHKLKQLSLANKILIALFLIGLLPVPYGFYMIIKIGVCVVLYMYYQLIHNIPKRSDILNISFVVLAVLYNPFMPISLGSKAAWLFVNIATLLFFTLILEQLKTKQIEEER